MKWYELCLIMICGTACVTLFMMFTANNPSADDFWRGTGSSSIGFSAGFGAAKLNEVRRKKAA